MQLLNCLFTLLICPESRHFCPHCEETVSLTTFHGYKQLYYNEGQHRWKKASESVESDSESEDFYEQDEGMLEYDSDLSLQASSVDGKKYTL